MSRCHVELAPQASFELALLQPCPAMLEMGAPFVVIDELEIVCQGASGSDELEIDGLTSETIKQGAGECPVTGATMRLTATDQVVKITKVAGIGPLVVKRVGAKARQIEE